MLSMVMSESSFCAFVCVLGGLRGFTTTSGFCYAVPLSVLKQGKNDHVYLGLIYLLKETLGIKQTAK